MGLSLSLPFSHTKCVFMSFGAVCAPVFWSSVCSCVLEPCVFYLLRQRIIKQDNSSSKVQWGMMTLEGRPVVSAGAFTAQCDVSYSIPIQSV